MLLEGFGHLGVCKFNFDFGRARADKFFPLVGICEIAMNSGELFWDLKASIRLTDHLKGEEARGEITGVCMT